MSPGLFPGCQKGAAEVAKLLASPNGNHGAGHPQPRQLLGHIYPKPADSRARNILNGWASRPWKPRLPESLPSSLPASRQRASASAQVSRNLLSALLSASQTSPEGNACLSCWEAACVALHPTSYQPSHVDTAAHLVSHLTLISSPLP